MARRGALAQLAECGAHVASVCGCANFTPKRTSEDRVDIRRRFGKFIASPLASVRKTFPVRPQADLPSPAALDVYLTKTDPTPLASKIDSIA